MLLEWKGASSSAAAPANAPCANRFSAIWHYEPHWYRCRKVVSCFGRMRRLIGCHTRGTADGDGAARIRQAGIGPLPRPAAADDRDGGDRLLAAILWAAA